MVTSYKRPELSVIRAHWLFDKMGVFWAMLAKTQFFISINNPTKTSWICPQFHWAVYLGILYREINLVLLLYICVLRKTLICGELDCVKIGLEPLLGLDLKATKVQKNCYRGRSATYRREFSFDIVYISLGFGTEVGESIGVICATVRWLVVEKNEVEVVEVLSYRTYWLRPKNHDIKLRPFGRGPHVTCRLGIVRSVALGTKQMAWVSEVNLSWDQGTWSRNGGIFIL